jgi:hypothetical protein
VPLDFTLAAFEGFCRTVDAVPVLTLADTLTQTAPLPSPCLILRVDVDYREQHAVQLAQIAAAYRLRGSFYFRCARGIFALDVIRQIAGLGHEVGYHFETLDTCRGDFDAASDLFLQHITLLRQAGFDIRTAAAHGSKPATSGYDSNLDLLTHRPELFNRAGLLGETTLSIDFERVTYVSDAGWRWRRYEHYRSGLKGDRTSLRATLNDFRQWPTGLYINFHPQHWFDRPASMAFFRLRHRIGRQLRRARRDPATLTT